jgi:hypothetical protein
LNFRHCTRVQSFGLAQKELEGNSNPRFITSTESETNTPTSDEDEQSALR